MAMNGLENDIQRKIAEGVSHLEKREGEGK